MTLQEDAVPGEGIDAGVERGKRPERAKDEMAIMDDTVRVAIGLRVKGGVGLALEARAHVVDALLVRPGGDGGDERQ